MSVKKNRWRLVAALASSLGCIEDCGHWQFRLLLPDGAVFSIALVLAVRRRGVCRRRLASGFVGDEF